MCQHLCPISYLYLAQLEATKAQRKLDKADKPKRPPKPKAGASASNNKAPSSSTLSSSTSMQTPLSPPIQESISRQNLLPRPDPPLARPHLASSLPNAAMWVETGASSGYNMAPTQYAHPNGGPTDIGLHQTSLPSSSQYSLADRHPQPNWSPYLQRTLPPSQDGRPSTS